MQRTAAPTARLGHAERVRTGRRAFVQSLALGALGALGSGRVASALGAAGEAESSCQTRELAVEGEPQFGRRCVLLLPRHLGAGERAPLLVLLHGRGEADDPKTGARAWVERYGLAAAYERLRRAPVTRRSRRGEWTDARLNEVNASLAARPFGGCVVACPFTPNVFASRPSGAMLDDYALWLTESLIPLVQREAPVAPDRLPSLDGCSMGGAVGLEVFLRHPERFGAWGGVQAAFGERRAAGHAERLSAALDRAGPRPIHLLTSTGDAFLRGNRSLATALAARRVEHELRVLPGPHDQPWLREAGTLEMLLWHERHFDGGQRG